MLTRYSMLRALKIVLAMETQRGRNAVFEQIAENNVKIRVAVAAYNSLHFPSLKAVAVLLYGMTCVLRVKPPEDEDCALVATGFFPNERRAIDDAQALLHDIPIGRFAPGWSHLATRRAYRGAGALAARLPQLLRIARRLARRYPFMPACRGFSALMYALLYRHRIAGLPAQVAVVTSSYAPDAVGMAAAAHAEGRRVLYLSHAHAPRNADYIAPVYADMSVLAGPADAETLQRKGALESEVLFRGIPVPPAPLRTSPLHRDRHDLTIGIFLTGAVDEGHLREVVDRVSKTLAPARICLRPHPVTLLRTDMSGLAAAFPTLEIANDMPIDAHARLCSFVICGNSSAALEVLKSGTPVLYHAGLDRLPHDYCGFAGNGLIPEATDIGEHVVPRLLAFYERPEWKSVMMRYDPFYLRDIKDIRMELRHALLCWVGKTDRVCDAA